MAVEEPRDDLAARQVTHVVPDSLVDVRSVMSYCGYPVEMLTVRSDLEWTDVSPELRCAHCFKETDGGA